MKHPYLIGLRICENVLHANTGGIVAVEMGSNRDSQFMEVTTPGNLNVKTNSICYLCSLYNHDNRSM